MSCCKDDGRVFQWTFCTVVTMSVTPTKMLYVGPGRYWDGWQCRYVTSHPGQLSLLPSAGWEMTSSQSVVMLCSWGIKAGTAHSTTTILRLFEFCLGKAGTRKVKPETNLDFLEQETVSGSGISWAICKSAPRSRPITIPALHHSVFTGQMPFLLPNQQRQSTEGLQTTEGLWLMSPVWVAGKTVRSPH